MLAYRLLHPKFGHEKEYEVTVAEFISDGAIKKLERGVKLDGELTQPTKIRRLGRTKFGIVLREGKYHHIKRICQRVGSEVINLRRIRMENDLARPLSGDGAIYPGRERTVSQGGVS